MCVAKPILTFEEHFNWQTFVRNVHCTCCIIDIFLANEPTRSTERNREKEEVEDEHGDSDKEEIHPISVSITFT